MYYQDYLRRFAYLGKSSSDLQVKELHGDPDRQLTLNRFQHFAGLNVTGKCTDV